MSDIDINQILAEHFGHFSAERHTLVGKGIPSVSYAVLPLTHFKVKNPNKHNLSNSRVIVPRQSVGRLKERLSILVQGDSPDCLFVFARTAAGGQQTFILNGADNKVLSLSGHKMTFSARMVGRNSLLIGEGTFIASARIALVDTDFEVGAHGLWSDEILIQGSDQHGIIDLQTGQLVNAGRNRTTIGRHVWLGRRSTIAKNVEIGDGSIVGTCALVTKDVPTGVAVGGVPAKIVRMGVSWSNSRDGVLKTDKYDIQRLRKLHAEPREGLVSKIRSFFW